MAQKLIERDPIRQRVAAVSCGIHQGNAVLDLDYAEDSSAGCDGNFVLTDDGKLVEAQITAEGECFDEEGLLRLLRLARIGCTEIFARAGRRGGRGKRAVRKLEAGRLVIASHNEGKVREIRDLLGPYGVEPVSAAELDLPEPDEIGTTFIDNGGPQGARRRGPFRPAGAGRR
jgi:hypothetical protein